MSEDFEESFRVKKVGEWKWEGVHPLKLPLRLARGVYGGHTVAQTLLVGIESAPGYIPNSFHSYFIGPGDRIAYWKKLCQSVYQGGSKGHCAVKLSCFFDEKGC